AQVLLLAGRRQGPGPAGVDVEPALGLEVDDRAHVAVAAVGGIRGTDDQAAAELVGRDEDPVEPRLRDRLQAPGDAGVEGVRDLVGLAVVAQDVALLEQGLALGARQVVQGQVARALEHAVTDALAVAGGLFGLALAPAAVGLALHGLEERQALAVVGAALV